MSLVAMKWMVPVLLQGLQECTYWGGLKICIYISIQVLHIDWHRRRSHFIGCSYPIHGKLATDVAL